MKKFATSVAALALGATFTMTAFAGGPDVVAPPAPSFVPGFYFGLGGGFASASTRGTANLHSEQDGGHGFSPITDNTQIGLAPKVQLGYMAEAGDDGHLLWGVNLSYSYLGLNYNDNVLDGANVFDYGVSYSHFVQLLLQLGHRFSHNLIGYFGAGGSYMDARIKTNDVANPGGFHNQHQSYWGVSGALGMLLALPHGFFLDGSYSMTYFFNEHTVTGSGDNRVQAHVTGRPIVNTLMFSVNKSFNS